MLISFNKQVYTNERTKYNARAVFDFGMLEISVFFASAGWNISTSFHENIIIAEHCTAVYIYIIARLL